MFIDKYKVHPKNQEDSELAEEFESKTEAEKRCEELNEKLKELEWVVTSFMENIGF
jgi:hypothetical protein